MYYFAHVPKSAINIFIDCCMFCRNCVFYNKLNEEGFIVYFEIIWQVSDMLWESTQIHTHII
jgi:hypothetical protein